MTQQAVKVTSNVKNINEARSKREAKADSIEKPKMKSVPVALAEYVFDKLKYFNGTHKWGGDWAPTDKELLATAEKELPFDVYQWLPPDDEDCIKFLRDRQYAIDYITKNRSLNDLSAASKIVFSYLEEKEKRKAAKKAAKEKRRMEKQKEKQDADKKKQELEALYDKYEYRGHDPAAFFQVIMSGDPVTQKTKVPGADNPTEHTRDIIFPTLQERLSAARTVLPYLIPKPEPKSATEDKLNIQEQIDKLTATIPD